MQDLRFFNQLIESSINDSVKDNIKPHVKWKDNAVSLNTNLLSCNYYYLDWLIKSINTTKTSIANIIIEPINGPKPTIFLPDNSSGIV